MRVRVVVPLLLIAALVLVPASPAFAWTSTKIGDDGSDPDASVVNGVSAVAYVKRNPSPSADSVMYATLGSNGTWTRSTVLANSVFFGSANPQLALESDGTPWVSFNIFSDTRLYFRSDSGTWTWATGMADAHTYDLRILPNGRPALVHSTAAGALAYSIYDPDTDTLDTEPLSAKTVSVAASLRVVDGLPRVAFDANDGTVNYASRSATGWAVQTVTSAASGSGHRPSLAFGPAGLPRIAYVTDGGLWYSFRKNGVWTRTRIYSNPTSLNPSLRTAPSGSPQIAFTTGDFSSGPFVLRFANSTASGWIFSVVASSVGGPHLGGISLVTGTDGRSRIAYAGTVTVRWARP